MDIAYNETVFLSGASGAGKTTLLYTLAGLERPESGTVKFEGRELYTGGSSAEARLRNEKMGFVFQGYFLLHELTALENVLVPLELAGMNEAQERATELLQTVGLGERLHHYPVQLSGGEQQRVAVARAFACRPPILLADEPTGNLDSATGEHMMQLLHSLHRDYGTTLVLVTHDHSIASSMERVITLRDGRIESDRLTDSDHQTAEPSL